MLSLQIQVGWEPFNGVGGVILPPAVPAPGRCQALRLPSFHAQHLIQGDQPRAP